MRTYFRRSGNSDRFPRSRGKRKQTFPAPGMTFLEKLDRDRACQKPVKGGIRESVYRCLKQGNRWRIADMQFLCQFAHPLNMLCEFVEERGRPVTEELLVDILHGIRTGKLDIGKYRLDDRAA